MSAFKVGDKVTCHYPGSWVDGREATVTALDVVSSDDIHGHALKVEGVGVTVLEPEFLRHTPSATPRPVGPP